jgi:hypothetical protein
MQKIIIALSFIITSLSLQEAYAHGGRWDCSFTNEFHKTYSGSGDSREDAIAMARGHCMREYSSIFCDKAPSCSPAERHVYWECVVTSDFNKTYFGQGRSQTQAEARARQQCTRDVNGMFCDKVTCNSWEN